MPTHMGMPEMPSVLKEILKQKEAPPITVSGGDAIDEHDGYIADNELTTG